MNGWMTMKEVAEHLSMGIGTIQKMMREGEIPPKIVKRIGNTGPQMINRKGLEEWRSSESEWVTMHQAARYLGVSLRSIQRMMKDERIPPNIVRRFSPVMVRISRTGLEDWVSSQGGDK
jgi:excisionase family DNA binding protein